MDLSSALGGGILSLETLLKMKEMRAARAGLRQELRKQKNRHEKIWTMIMTANAAWSEGDLRASMDLRPFEK